MPRGDKNRPAIVIEDDTKRAQKYNLPQSTILLVTEYAKFYSASTGTTVNEDQVVNSTLAQYLAGDKVFQQWRAAQSASTSTPTASAGARKGTTAPGGGSGAAEPGK